MGVEKETAIGRFRQVLTSELKQLIRQGRHVIVPWQWAVKVMPLNSFGLNDRDIVM